jgi:uncharacterized protein
MRLEPGDSGRTLHPSPGEPRSNPILFDASVTVFKRFIETLRQLLEHARLHCVNGHTTEQQLLALRLAPSMLAFEIQVQIAANFMLRTCFPLAGKEIPSFGEYSSSIGGLLERVDYVEAQLALLKPADFLLPTTARITTLAGEKQLDLSAQQFLFEYAMPNFYFHLTMVYALLRYTGVELSKSDFDGFHQYEPVSR